MLLGVGGVGGVEMRERQGTTGRVTQKGHLRDQGKVVTSSWKTWRLICTRKEKELTMWIKVWIEYSVPFYLGFQILVCALHFQVIEWLGKFKDGNCCLTNQATRQDVTLL